MLRFAMSFFTCNIYAANSAPEWENNKSYLKGEHVTYNFYIYEAKYWTKGNKPNQCENGNPWKTITKSDEIQAWNNECIYDKNDQVSYNSKIYKAKWWSKNNIPSEGDPWEKQTIPTGSLKVNVKGETIPANAKISLILGSSGIVRLLKFGNQEFTNIVVGSYNKLTVNSVTYNGAVYSAKLDKDSIVITPGGLSYLNIILSKKMLPKGSLKVTIFGFSSHMQEQLCSSKMLKL